MFRIDENTKQIQLTRGDVAPITIFAKNKDNTDYEFKKGDIVRFKIYERSNCNNVVLQKDIEVKVASTKVDMKLTKEETKIGDLINEDVDYWYEVKLNPETNPKTIIGYEMFPGTNKAWEKIFKLLPEGSDKK